MVDNGCDMSEEPLVRAVSDPVYVFARRARQVAPSLGDDGPNARYFDSVQDDLNGALGVVKHDASEPNIDRLRASRKKTHEIFRRRVCGWATEEEPTDICEYRC
jgi:hypothetical protein